MKVMQRDMQRDCNATKMRVMQRDMTGMRLKGL